MLAGTKGVQGTIWDSRAADACTSTRPGSDRVAPLPARVLPDACDGVTAPAWTPTTGRPRTQEEDVRAAPNASAPAVRPTGWSGRSAEMC